MCITFYLVSESKTFFFKSLLRKEEKTLNESLFAKKIILVVVGHLPPVTQLIAKVHLLSTKEEISAERSHSTSDLVWLQNPLD